MDNLTHTLIGVTAANAGLSRRFGRGTMLALILASNIPDVDIFWAHAVGGGVEIHLIRRAFTHSVFGVPLLSALGAAILKPFYKNQPWKTLFGLFLLGAGLHSFFDLINSYGVVLLHPLSRRRFELAWVFIIDLALWGIMLVPLLLGWIKSRWTDLHRLSRAAAAGVALYVAFCGAGRAWAWHLLRKTAEQENRRPGFEYVFPEALGPHRFRGVLKEDGEYGVYQIRLFSGEAELKKFYPTEEDAPAVAAARQTALGKKLDWFFKAPVWRSAPGGAEVFDLRFVSTVLPGRDAPFVYRVPLEKKE